MVGHILKPLALSPLLAAQAVQVRRRALILPEPPGPRAGEAGDGPPLRLLMLGDSSAAGVGAGHQDRALMGQLVMRLARSHRLSWRLEAETGATSASALARVRAIRAEPFDLGIVVLGVNDVTRLVPRRQFIARRRAIHDILRTRFGIRRFIATGLPPMGRFPLLPQPLRGVLAENAARLDAALARFCAEASDCTYLPLDLPFEPRFVAEDGFHPSEDAYAELAVLLARLI